MNEWPCWCTRVLSFPARQEHVLNFLFNFHARITRLGGKHECHKKWHKTLAHQAVKFANGQWKLDTEHEYLCQQADIGHVQDQGSVFYLWDNFLAKICIGNEKGYKNFLQKLYFINPTWWFCSVCNFSPSRWIPPRIVCLNYRDKVHKSSLLTFDRTAATPLNPWEMETIGCVPLNHWTTSKAVSTHKSSDRTSKICHFHRDKKTIDKCAQKKAGKTRKKGKKKIYEFNEKFRDQIPPQ